MWKQVFTVVALALLIYWAFDFVDWQGFYRRTYNHAPGLCHQVPGIEYGSEDIQALPSGLAFISSGFRTSTKDVYTKRPGRIYLFDFNKPEDAAVELKIIADPSYKLVSPHGISIWTDSATGTVFLYVISHSPGEIVDKFRFDESTRTLTHIKRITGDPSFYALNDIAVVGEDQFYFTNYWYLNMGLEFLLGLQWGSIGFYDGTGGTILVSNLSVPSGLVFSKDHKYLYVALFGTEEIHVYERNEDNSVTFSHAIKVNSGIDNLDLDATTGDLWAGLLPIGYKIVRHLDNPEKFPHSPSQVLRIKLDAHSRPVKIEEIYSNDGTEVSGSTVAVKHGRGFLIGTAVANTLYCEIE